MKGEKVYTPFSEDGIFQLSIMQMIIVYASWCVKIYGGFMPDFLFLILLYN